MLWYTAKNIRNTDVANVHVYIEGKRGIESWLIDKPVTENLGRDLVKEGIIEKEYKSLTVTDKRHTTYKLLTIAKLF